MALDTYALSTVDSLQAYANLQGCGVSVPQIESLINAASAWIERVAARKIKARDYVQWYNGQWQEQLQLDQYPVDNKVGGVARMCRKRLSEQGQIVRLLDGLKDQGWIGGRIRARAAARRQAASDLASPRGRGH